MARKLSDKRQAAMPGNPPAVDIVELQYKEYCAAVLIDEFGNDMNLEVQSRYHVESLAHMLRASIKVPGKVLQDRRVIASYPTTLWQHIKKLLGMQYTEHQVCMSEHVLFPAYAKEWNKLDGPLRIHLTAGTSTYTPGDEEDTLC